MSTNPFQPSRNRLYKFISYTNYKKLLGHSSLLHGLKSLQNTFSGVNSMFILSKSLQICVPLLALIFSTKFVNMLLRTLMTISKLPCIEYNRFKLSIFAVYASSTKYKYHYKDVIQLRGLKFDSRRIYSQKYFVPFHKTIKTKIRS